MMSGEVKTLKFAARRYVKDYQIESTCKSVQ